MAGAPGRGRCRARPLGGQTTPGTVATNVCGIGAQAMCPCTRVLVRSGPRRRCGRVGTRSRGSPSTSRGGSTARIGRSRALWCPRVVTPLLAVPDMPCAVKQTSELVSPPPPKGSFQRGVVWRPARARGGGGGGTWHVPGCGLCRVGCRGACACQVDRAVSRGRQVFFFLVQNKGPFQTAVGWPLARNGFYWPPIHANSRPHCIFSLCGQTSGRSLFGFIP